MNTSKRVAWTLALAALLPVAVAACDTTDTAVMDPGPSGSETQEPNDSGDTKAPVLTFADFSPQRVSVGRTGELVDIFVSLEDADSGVGLVTAQFKGPREARYSQFTDLRLVEGDSKSGDWKGSIFVSPNAESGIWTLLLIRADDKAGNRARWTTEELQARGVPVELRVTS